MTRTSEFNPGGQTVVAYFESGADAQNAINELVDEGFPADEIGAVFHSRGGAAAAERNAVATGSPSRPRHDEMNQVGSVGSAASTSGAESDTSGVTPAGLATGAGTGFTGAPRPGPIPGSEIPSTIPSELPSSLESELPKEKKIRQDLDASYGGLTAAPSSAHYDRTRGSATSDDSWWEKLKHVFSGEKRQPQSEKSAANFGTGEGRIGVADYDYPYSSSAFESSFGSMGIPETRAQRLSKVIRRGGAIVTVSTESRQAEAESILERNHGRIREDSSALAQEDARSALSDTSRVQVFGRVQRVYPGYISPDETSRRAS